MKTTDKSDASQYAYQHNTWYSNYPNGPYWIVPNLDWHYNPPLKTFEPIKIYNSGSTTIAETYHLFTPEQPEVNILVNNNRQKITKSNSISNPLNYVYLNEGEFAIEIFNKSSVTLGAKIKINGKYISSSHLIVYAGQRIVLDRFLDSIEKLKFTVYTVDKNNSHVEKAIENNGSLEIEFYLEDTTINPPYDVNRMNWLNVQSSFPPAYDNTVYGHNSSIHNFYCQNLGNSTSTITHNQNIPSTLTTSTSINLDDLKTTKETGIVDKGSKSDQEFKVVEKRFFTHPFETFKYKLLPKSEKPIEAKDLILYCTDCGKKAHRTHKFCSHCGTKI